MSHGENNIVKRKSEMRSAIRLNKSIIMNLAHVVSLVQLKEMDRKGHLYKIIIIIIINIIIIILSLQSSQQEKW
jgi:hypothetical protein